MNNQNDNINRDLNNLDIDDDEDMNIEDLENEFKQSGMEIEIVEGDPYDDVIYDDMIEEMKDNITQEEESFKNDEDYKKMLERKVLVTLNAFPDFESEGEIYSVAIDEKRKTALIGDGEEFLYRMNLDTNKIEFKEKIHTDSIISIRYSFDKSVYLTASMDGIINIYNGEDHKLLLKIEDNTEEIMWTDWHSKGLVFSFGTSSGAAYVYNAKNGECMKSLFGHNDSCTAGSFSLDGKFLLTASSDKTVKIWELKTAQCKFTVRGNKFHKADILCLAIGKSKNILATGSGFNELAIVNYDNGAVSNLIYLLF